MKVFAIGVRLNSSNLDVVAYDPATRRLAVHFKSGEGYLYEGVPQSVWEGLLGASSHGSYFSKQIRGRFDDNSENLQFLKVVSLDEWRRGPKVDPIKVNPKEMETMAKTAWW